MPRTQDGYSPPTSWSDIEYPEYGNQADWVYAITSALSERLTVGGGALGVDAFSWNEKSKLDSYMFFQFADMVDSTIIGMLGNPVKYKASNGDVIEVREGQNRKLNGWLNPEEPMIVGVNNDDGDLWIAGPMGYINYNFLNGKELLQMEGCNFREPLSAGWSTLETCYPIWFDRVKNAINKLHMSPVPVNWASESYWGIGISSNYDDETMGGAAVDGLAWNAAVSDYGNHGYSGLPDGDSGYYYSEDKFRFYSMNWTDAERRKIDKEVIPWAEWTYRSDIDINGEKIYLKRLRGNCPFGCHVYLGGVATTGAIPNGGYQYDEFHSSYPQNTLFTIDCGRVLASDPYRYIGEDGWTLLIDDTERYHPPYEEPEIEEGEGSGRKRTIWGHDLECWFYADWTEESDGFRFKGEE